MDHRRRTQRRKILASKQESLRIFLDSSVILSACGSRKSLSRLITLIAKERRWELVSSIYCRAESARNIVKFDAEAITRWRQLETQLIWLPTVLTTSYPMLFTVSKDKPVLISALAAKSHVLLTLNRGDFGTLLETEVYGMKISTPHNFLIKAG